MPLGADDVQAAQVGNAFTQLDVRATTCHVGGNRDSPSLAGPGNNFRLLGVVLGVEDTVGNLGPLQHSAQEFR